MATDSSNWHETPQRDAGSVTPAGGRGRGIAGKESALAELFTRNRDRLRRMVRLRLDRRLPSTSRTTNFPKSRAAT